MSKRRVAFVVGLLVSVAGLCWAFSGVEWGRVRAAFSNPRLYAWSVPVLALSLLSAWGRGVRSYYLLRHEARIGQMALFRITMIGFCYNSILPARAGEFIRAWLLGREQGLGFAKAAASLVVERVYDLLMILLCFAFALMAVQIDPAMEVRLWGDFSLQGSQIAPTARGLVVTGLIGAFAIVLLQWRPVCDAACRLIDRLTALPAALRERLAGLVHSFASGLRSIKDPGAVAAVVALSFFIWLTVALTVWTLQFAFPEMARLTLSDSFAITVIICFAVMLPSGPAYFGMFEAGGVFALLILGATSDQSLALSFTLALHILQILPIVVLGLYFAIRDHISLREIESRAA